MHDGQPVKTFLSVSNSNFAFSYLVSNLFIMHQVKAAKMFAYTWTSFQQPPLLSKPFWFFIATPFSPVSIKKCFQVEKNLLPILNFDVKSPGDLHSQVISTFVSAYGINASQNFPKHFLMTVDLYTNFNFQPFQLLS